ncbi:hypothetical protein TNCV_2916141 [Trichonephila clavipes]|nr:hypothetical protein TNCV_2916141 [Trichonephila clavipes]
MVKITDSWLACHEFESSTAEGLRVRGWCTLNLWKLKRPHVGVVGKLGEGDARSCVVLDYGLKLRGSSPKALE